MELDYQKLSLGFSLLERAESRFSALRRDNRRFVEAYQLALRAEDLGCVALAAQTLVIKASCLTQLGNREERSSVVRKLAELGLEDLFKVDAFQAAIFVIEAGEDAKGIEMMDRHIRLFPGDTEAMLQFGEGFLLAGRDDRSLDLFFGVWNGPGQAWQRAVAGLYLRIVDVSRGVAADTWVDGFHEFLSTSWPKSLPWRFGELRDFMTRSDLPGSARSKIERIMELAEAQDLEALKAL